MASSSIICIVLRCAVLLMISVAMADGLAVTTGRPAVRDDPSEDGSEDPVTHVEPKQAGPRWGSESIVLEVAEARCQVQRSLDRLGDIADALRLALNHVADERKTTQGSLDKLAGIEAQLKDPNECISSPCQNGGACVRGINNFRCVCAAGYTGVQCEIKARDCSDVKRAEPDSASGLYTINPNDTWSAQVYCDMNTDRGGWTVFQRRLSGRVNFYRNWAEYAAGFGDLDDEFWLGNRLLHALTRSRNYRLRVDLADFENNTRVAEYTLFAVASEQDGFRLSLGTYSGTAGDSLTAHNNAKFSTEDVDNDSDSGKSCAQTYKGCWWYTSCHHSNLNGRYLQGPHTSPADGVNWRHWKGYYYSLKTTSMSIRPLDF